MLEKMEGPTLDRFILSGAFAANGRCVGFQELRVWSLGFEGLGFKFLGLGFRY